MNDFTYALYTEPTKENDLADWYDDLGSAMTAAREAIDEGRPADDVAIMKLYADCGECAWGFCITFDDQGRAWSESWAAREDMGAIQ